MSVLSSPPVSAARQRTLRLQQRTFQFTAQVLASCPRRFGDEPSRVIWRQAIRAASSALLNLEEADEASSSADFVARMKIATREAKESRRCLSLLRRCRLANAELLVHLEDEARQLAAIFATIVIKVKRRLSRR